MEHFDIFCYYHKIIHMGRYILTQYLPEVLHSSFFRVQRIYIVYKYG